MKIDLFAAVSVHRFAAWSVLLAATIISATNEDGPPEPQTFRGFRPVWTTSDNVTKLMIGNETLSFHPVQDESAPFAVSQYSITCCRDGTPQPDPSLAPYIHEWSQEMVGVERNKSCRRFNGYYSVPTWVMQQQKTLVVGVRCKCPDDGNLDRNCRYLPDCANGGYRSFSINLRCVCPPKWFGDLCEKFCLNGELYKDFASGTEDGLGVDRCKCMKHFYGEACDEVQCFNGGTPVKNRGCLCLQPYVGPHCEEMAGVIGQLDTPNSSSSFHRDLSSTVVSLFLAVALALGVYFLVRRRTHWMRQRMQARRAVMMGGADEAGSAPRGSPGGLSGPPPTYYALADQQRAAEPNADVALYDVSGLPPPPSYNEIVKVPPAYVDARSQQAPVAAQQEPVLALTRETVAPVVNLPDAEAVLDAANTVNAETPSSSSAALDSSTENRAVAAQDGAAEQTRQGASDRQPEQPSSCSEAGDPASILERRADGTAQKTDSISRTVHMV